MKKQDFEDNLNRIVNKSKVSALMFLKNAVNSGGTHDKDFIAPGHGLGLKECKDIIDEEYDNAKSSKDTFARLVYRRLNKKQKQYLKNSKYDDPRFS